MDTCIKMNVLRTSAPFDIALLILGAIALPPLLLAIQMCGVGNETDFYRAAMGKWALENPTSGVAEVWIGNDGLILISRSGNALENIETVTNLRDGEMTFTGRDNTKYRLFFLGLKPYLQINEGIKILLIRATPRHVFYETAPLN